MLLDSSTYPTSYTTGPPHSTTNDSAAPPVNAPRHTPTMSDIWLREVVERVLGGDVIRNLGIILGL
jgi:hypothetical protein